MLHGSVSVRSLGKVPCSALAHPVRCQSTRMKNRPIHSNRIRKPHLLFASFCSFCAFLLPSCGSTSGTPVGPGAVLVTIQPQSATVLLGETQPFTASVTGSTNTTVT